MINPPSEGLPQGVPISAGMPDEPLGINASISPEEQAEIVAICNKFKQSQENFAREKKRKMRDCYAYSKSKFLGNDLLPLPQGEGSDKDMQANRPQVFIPKIREQVKTIYSYIKLTLFPNDTDFFRVRAQSSRPVMTRQPMMDPYGQPVIDAMGKPVMMPLVRDGQVVTYPMLEDELTDGLKYLFKQALITEKLGPYIQYLVEMGNGCVFPKINKEQPLEWTMNEETNQYQAEILDQLPLPDLEVWNPLHFYLDPYESNPENSKWVYCCTKKVQEIKDSEYYFNNTDDRLEKLASNTITDRPDSQVRTTEYTGLNSTFEDIEPSVAYDLYYFPFLKLKSGKQYRNMLVGVAGRELMVRWHPSLSPRGKNPVVHNTWMNDTQSPYGIGPVEDMMELQKLVNMIYNHATETLARIGNRFGVREGTDIDSLWGVAGGVVVTKNNPKDEIMSLTGDYSEIAALMNFGGTLTAELQQVSGAQNPFQGASQIDFKKTATELQILQENAISVNREIVEHIAVMGVQRILELLMYLVAKEFTEAIEVRVDDPTGKPLFKLVDFSPLLSGQYTIALVNVNPSQSKQAQVTTLMQFVQLIASSPGLLPILQPVLEKIAMLQGLRDGPELLQKIIGIMQQMSANAPPPQQPGEPPDGAPPQEVQQQQAGLPPEE